MPQPQPPIGGKQLLVDKNTKLSAQVATQRKEINDLKDRLQKLEDEEIKWRETAACLTSVWDELNSSIGFLHFKINKSAEVAPAGLDASSAKALLEEANPFLAHLLDRYLPDDPVAAKSAKSLANDLSETEKALRNRMKDTMRVAASILNAIDELKGSGGDAVRSLPSFEESKLTALVNILKSENGKLAKESLSDSIAIRKLEADIADKEAEIQVLQRKLIMDKSTERAGGDVGVSRSEEPQQEVSKGGVSRNGSEQRLSDHKEGGPRVEALKKEVEKRDGDIARLESELYTLRREIDSRSENVKIDVAQRQEKLDLLTADVERVKQKLKDSYREQDRLNAKLREATRDLDRGQRALRRETRLEDAISELEAQVKRLRTERNEAERRLQQSTQNDSPQTRHELLQQMQGMETEMKMLKDAVSKHQKAAEIVEEAEKLKSTHEVEIAEYRSRVADMDMQVSSAMAKLDNWIRKYVDQVKINEELRCFMELSHEYLGKHDTMEMSMRDAIHEYLQAQMPSLEKRIKEGMKELSSEREKQMVQEIKELRNELEGLKGQHAGLLADVGKVRAEKAALMIEADTFWKEMDSVSEAYEASREQNTKLLSSMSKRDEDNAKLLSEAAAAARDKTIMEEERDMAQRLLKSMEEKARDAEERASKIEERFDTLSRERDSYKTDLQHAKEQIESVRSEAKALGISMDALRSELSNAKKDIEKIEADKAKHLAALKSEKTRADRAEGILSGRKDLKLQASEEAERQALRKMVNCNVCSTRLKDRIITKCNHLFCSACIDVNLSSRHRKCPGCGEKFGAGDVKPFYFT